MKGKLSLFTALALAGSIGFAAAQSSPPSPSTSPGASSPPAASSNQGKCFDKLTGQIKDKMASTSSPGASLANKNDNAGMSSTPPGAAPSTTGSGSASSPSTGTGSASVQRPAAAAGLPDC